MMMRGENPAKWGTAVLNSVACGWWARDRVASFTQSFKSLFGAKKKRLKKNKQKKILHTLNYIAPRLKTRSSFDRYFCFELNFWYSCCESYSSKCQLFVFKETLKEKKERGESWLHTRSSEVSRLVLPRCARRFNGAANQRGFSRASSPAAATTRIHTPQLAGSVERPCLSALRACPRAATARFLIWKPGARARRQERSCA